MADDPIMAELRAVREALLAEYGGDLASLVRAARAAGDRTGVVAEVGAPKRIEPTLDDLAVAEIGRTARCCS